MPTTHTIVIDGQNVELTPELIERYDVPGPRYTSYPTAPMWKNDFGVDDAKRVIAASNEAADGVVRPLSLYTHLPFCEQLCLFCGCSLIVHPKTAGRTPDNDRAGAYLATLKHDIELAGELVDDARPVVQFHWGGGTPTYYEPEQLEELFNCVKANFHFADDAEIGVEVDPRVTTPAHLETLHRLGFNRISMGVQDFDPEVQETVKRVQSLEMVQDMVTRCRELGFESVNIDLMYGLPLQTAANFAKTVDAVIKLNPDRIALFNYGHVPWIKKYQQMLTPLLPTPDVKVDIFLMAVAALTAAGYTYIGMDHFVHPDDELCVAQHNGTLHRNFQGYSTKAGADLLGFGITSIGEVGTSYLQNWRDIDHWREAIEADTLPIMRGCELSGDDVIRRAAISDILCQTVIDKPSFSSQFGIDFDSYFAADLPKLEPMAADGLVELTPDAIRVTPLGRFFLRNVAMIFDAYLDPNSERPMFSRTV